MTRSIAFRSTLAVAAVLFAPLVAHAAPTHAATAAAPPHAVATGAHHGAAKMATPKIDINAANETELATLPGIDATTAQKIVEGRPYKSIQQLVSKNIVNKDEFVKLRGRIIARPIAAESHAKDGATMKSTPKTNGSSEGETH